MGRGEALTYQLRHHHPLPTTFNLYLLLASSLESQSFVMLPPSDEMVTNLETLTHRCLHGKNYCRRVLCLYELSKVVPKWGASTGTSL